MRLVQALWIAATTLVACHDTYGGGGAGAGDAGPPASPSATAAAAPSTAPSARRQAAPKTPPNRNPMGAYTRDVVNKYDARSACLAGCAAGLRCKLDALFGGGGVEVGERLRACRKACDGEGPNKPAYLPKAKACLASGSCEAFAQCAGTVLLLPEK